MVHVNIGIRLSGFHASPGFDTSSVQTVSSCGLSLNGHLIVRRYRKRESKKIQLLPSGRLCRRYKIKAKSSGLTKLTLIQMRPVIGIYGYIYCLRLQFSCIARSYSVILSRFRSRPQCYRLFSHTDSKLIQLLAYMVERKLNGDKKPWYLSNLGRYT